MLCLCTLIFHEDIHKMLKILAEESSDFSFELELLKPTFFGNNLIFSPKFIISGFFFMCTYFCRLFCTNYFTCIGVGIFFSGFSEFLNVFILEIDSQADKVVIDGRYNFFKAFNFYKNI